MLAMVRREGGGGGQAVLPGRGMRAGGNGVSIVRSSGTSLAVFFLICTLRLGYFIKKLPYYILSVQPIVAEDKTGFFTRLGCFLEEKIERGDKLEKI